MALKRRTYTLPSEQVLRSDELGGRGGRNAAFGVIQGETAAGADLGGT